MYLMKLTRSRILVSRLMRFLSSIILILPLLVVSSYVKGEIFDITSNDELAVLAQTGDGSENSPYLISGLVRDGLPASATGLGIKGQMLMWKLLARQLEVSIAAHTFTELKT